MGDLGSKESWRKKSTYLRLVYSGVRTKKETEAMRWAEMVCDSHCRHCDQIVEWDNADVLAGYWRPVWFVCHKDCREAGKKLEAYDCQKLDADCNDCLHFKRGVNVTEENAWRDNPGWCALKQVETQAYPKFATLMPCFVHRLSANPPL